ncbi:MAG: ABC transporter ATP-binding protein [bacterium]
MALLEVKNLTKKFGGLTAVSNFNLTLNKGEIVGLIGPNGAGKTTVFNLLTGVYQPTEGSIDLEGRSLLGLKPYQITERGMARTFQNIRLFKDLTVLDNVRTANHLRTKSTMLEAVLRLPRFLKEEEETTAKAMNILQMVKLDHRRDEIAKSLPYGEQRRLEIARALATGTKILFLDEPAAGMNPQETHDLMEFIGWIRDEFDLTIILIEHDMKLVMKVCERLLVLDYGAVIAEGLPEEIKNNKRVIEAYLGEEVS